MKHGRKVVDNKKAFCIIVLLVIILVNIVLWCTVMKGINLETVSYATSIEDVTVYNEIEQFDLTDIINENTNEIVSEELIVEEEDIEYTSIYKNNSELPKGTIQVIQEGRDGKQNIITKKTYKNGELVKEETDTQITIASIDRIVEIGTAKYTSNYKVKLGDYLFVTSNTLAIRNSPDKSASKNITIEKNSKVKLLEISGDWYYISYNTYKGWAQADCLTYIDPNASKYDEASGTYSKEELMSKLSQNMSLNKPSGLSIDQFKKVLSNNTSDKNNVLENNAEYFYYAEKQYNINGVFLAAVAIHESNWGTSKIAVDKNNLFGYGASDSNPYKNAKTFSSYAEGIDLVARVFVKYYLNPAGTSIYGGETAVGTYYNGSTLAGVNTRYASDKNWANGVYKWMSYLYNKL